jgi:hypothetical protein
LEPAVGLQSWVDVKISKSDQNNLHIRFSWEFEPPFNAFDWNTTRQGQKQQEEENTKNTSPEHTKWKQGATNMSPLLISLCFF